jgi:hypothetical protein
MTDDGKQTTDANKRPAKPEHPPNGRDVRHLHNVSRAGACTLWLTEGMILAR